MGRIELPTSPLPRECSTTEPHGRYFFVTGAGEGNRTLVVSLEGFCSTIELHPQGSMDSQLLLQLAFWWRRLDSNQRRRKPTDLQSAPFSHSGTPPQRTDDYEGTTACCQGLLDRSKLIALTYIVIPAPTVNAETPPFRGGVSGLAGEPDDYLLSHGNPHYHRRGVVSRSCSGWEGVGPTRYGHQA